MSKLKIVDSTPTKIKREFILTLERTTGFFRKKTTRFQIRGKVGSCVWHYYPDGYEVDVLWNQQILNCLLRFGAKVDKEEAELERLQRIKDWSNE